jgi:hypothetical protein
MDRFRNQSVVFGHPPSLNAFAFGHGGSPTVREGSLEEPLLTRGLLLGYLLDALGGKPMSDEPVVINTFDNEAEAEMAQQLIEDAGVRAFVSKDDAGGMEPHLQLTGGVRLVVARADAERAREILKQMTSDGIECRFELFRILA